MDFALQTALLGATVGGAVLTLSTLYGATQPGVPGAFRWWAAAFLVGTCSQAVVLGEGVLGAPVLPASDLLQGVAALLTVVGVFSLRGWRVGITMPLAGLAVVLGWGQAAVWLRHVLDLAGVPIFGIGGPPQLLAGWAFLSRRSPFLSGRRTAGFAFLARGLYQTAGPLLAMHADVATWGFVVGQILSMVMAVALLLVVVRRQAALTESAGERAAVLQTRLLDALGGVRDAVALYDSANRLVTWNDRYVEALGPCNDLARPGTHLRTVLRALANSGWVVNININGGDASSPEAIRDSAFFDGSEAAVRDVVREHQHADGRWVSVNTYPTADGGHLRILTDITPRKQAERALADSLAWVRGIMETMVDGLVALDQAGFVLSLNPAACRIFGYGLDEVIGSDAARLLADPADGVGAFAPGPLRQVEGRRKNGTLFPLEVAAGTMRQGNDVTYIAVVRDITDRKCIESALVESEQRLRDLAEAASDWFWETDARLVFTFVSGRVRPVLGVGPEFFLGRSFTELNSSCPDPVLWNEQLALMRAGKPFRGLVLRYVLPSGETRYVEMSGRPASTGGNCRAFRGTASDITALKWHEHELAAQSALRQGIIDNVAQGIVAFDERDRLAAINRAARHLLDLPGDGPVQTAATFGGFIRHLGRQGYFTGDTVVPLDRLRGAGSRVLDYVRPNGSVLEVRATTMPGGGPILTFSDVTERRRTEETLREAKEAAERGNRAKATFLANISHELRTPLNAVIGFSEMMKHEIYGPLEPAQYRSYVDDINDSGVHLLELINDVLDMSKAEVGMTDLVEGEVDVVAIVRSAMRMMATRAHNHGIEMVDTLPADLPPLFADERRVRQIVLNLLSNAVKFTEEGGQVIAAARLEAEGFVLVIRDTGIGMSAEDLERVMEPFVQVDSRLSRRFEGTGLGLPLAKTLVVAHQGQLRLESVVGAGTTATVIFPPGRIVDRQSGQSGGGI